MSRSSRRSSRPTAARSGSMSRAAATMPISAASRRAPCRPTAAISRKRACCSTMCARCAAGASSRRRCWRCWKARATRPATRRRTSPISAPRSPPTRRAWRSCTRWRRISGWIPSRPICAMCATMPRRACAGCWTRSGPAASRSRPTRAGGSPSMSPSTRRRAGRCWTSRAPRSRWTAISTRRRPCAWRRCSMSSAASAAWTSRSMPAA